MDGWVGVGVGAVLQDSYPPITIFEEKKNKLC